MRLSELRPARWGEDINATLGAIQIEAEHHVTENIVIDLIERAGELTSPSIPHEAAAAVSRLCSRAVVLAIEVERLRVENATLGRVFKT
jgi:hypothetical protein